MSSTTTKTDYAISMASVQAAAERINGFAHRTPVLTCHALETIAAGESGAPKRLFFKNLQKVGAFKYRGALNAVKKYLQEKKEKGEKTDTTFVTHSSGNHGQALALAARDANCKAVIVMPNNSPSVKQNAVRGYGAEVKLCAPTNEAREKAANEVVEATGARFVHPSNDPDVMNGQGTVALELLEQAKEYGVELDAIIVPIGGAGLCSGVAMAAKSVQPGIKVFAVEPTGAADAYNSFQKHELMGHTGPINTVADGLRTTLGDNNWPVVRDLVDEILLVSDDEIVSAMKLIWERMKLVVEPSGAVATAAVLAHKLPAGITNVGVVFSGGNVDLEKLPWAQKA
ncbi:hypothetical protein PHYSODRAFT_329918 [Phytophthora sojae]|uniref:Tryptophan synthase beta chain-like PALP domain-containing protein n=1 Tax=Phytophthora sojae (strain P6497) TaxID=1094619 RepID=G4ZB95_PHYSP|nr:hypothetical protein PHYSODRAFT_329918 [Phytophthora sojae]EGZ22061.1 hypothetical protein PHYSODRAFT_329918 [Phytophthora sojae]|eukprot:XP_009524778.1 hypothetical protein PHYSODRAFT_329918 [Phytophthora sojae]